MRRPPAPLALLALLAGFGVRAAMPGFGLPRFPLPQLVKNDYGESKRIGFMVLLRQLREGGASHLDDVDFVDEDYGELDSRGLPPLDAWLGAASRCVGVDLRRARDGIYDGAVFARLLEVATALAAVRDHRGALAMPIGVAICTRRNAWGDLPGDGARDAYLLIATEQGMLVYDPPTRQLSLLSEFPNHTDIEKIQF